MYFSSSGDSNLNSQNSNPFGQNTFNPTQSNQINFNVPQTNTNQFNFSSNQGQFNFSSNQSTGGQITFSSPDFSNPGNPCVSCGKVKPKSQFSRSQWSRASAQRKCLECCGQPKENSPKADPVCSICKMTKSREEFSKAQLNKNAATRKCKQCIEEHKKKMLQENKIRKDTKQREFLTSTSLDGAKLEELKTITQQSIEYIEQCAARVDEITIVELNNSYICVTQVYVKVMEARGHDMSEEETGLKQVLLHLRKQRLVSSKQVSSYFGVLEIMKKIMEAEPEREFLVNDKKVWLETIYKLILHTKDEIIPFLSNDRKGKRRVEDDEYDIAPQKKN